MPYLLLTLTTLFWSGNFVLSRGMHAQIPPMGLSFWRWAVALGILAFFGLHHLWRQRMVLRTHLRFIVVQGLLGVAGFNSLVYLAMQTTTAINAVLVNSCIPVLIVLVSWVMYREVLRARQCFGVAVSLCGVLLIITKGEVASLARLQINHGDLLVLIAALLWAIYSANLKRYPQDLHPLAYLCGIIIAGLAGITPFYLIEIYAGRTVPLNLPAVMTILYVAAFASVLAFIFWNRAVREIGANRAGPFVHLMPVFSTILATLFLGEALKGYHLEGICLIFCGILLTTWRAQQLQGGTKGMKDDSISKIKQEERMHGHPD